MPLAQTAAQSPSARFARSPYSAALLLLAALPMAARAAEAPAPEAQLPTVKVTGSGANEEFNAGVSTIGGGKTPTPIRDIPQSVTVIDRVILDTQNATSLAQALRNVPGITLSAGEGGNIGNNFNLRGFSARTDVYLDGFRDRGQYNRDTFSLEAVEVLAGPSSLLFGRGSTGGVINQASKRPTLAPVGQLTLSLGTDDYFRSTVDVGQKMSDTSAFRVAAMGQSVDSTRDIAGTEDYGIAPSLRFGIGAPTEVTVSLLSQRNDTVPDYGVPLLRFQGQAVATPVPARRDNFYGFTDDRFVQTVNVLGLGLRHKFGPNLTLSNKAQFSNYRTQASPTPLAGLVNPNTGAAIDQQTVSPSTPYDQLFVARSTRDRELSDTSLFNQTDLIAKVKLGPVQNTVTTGVEIGLDTYRNRAYTRYNANTTPSSTSISPLPPVNLGSPVYIDIPAGPNILRLETSDTHTRANTYAAYINNQMDLGKQWKLVTGLRWDQFSAEQTANTYTYAAPINPSTPARTTTVLGLESSDVQFSPRAGVIYQPSEQQSYYTSYGTSFNPSAETVTLTAANAPLDPEKNRSFEVGAKWDFFAGDLALTTAVFQVEKTNARTTSAGVTTLDGDLRVRGAELKVVGRPYRLVQVIGGYTFLDGEITESKDVGTGISAGVSSKGKTPQNVPRHSASLYGTYRFLPSWEAGGGLVYSASRYVNNFETARIDGYTRFDASLAWLQPKYDLRLNLQNLGDELYYETASGGRATAADGFRAVATASWRFL